MTRAEIPELSDLCRHASGDEKRRLKALAKILVSAKRRAGDGSDIGGTAFTVLRLTNSPIGRLIDRGSIGVDELRAADEICRAVYAISGALESRSPALQIIDGSRGTGAMESRFAAEIQQRYRRFANFWSVRMRRGDPTFSIVNAAVIRERPLDAIRRDLGLRHQTVRTALIGALRHYAAIAGFVDERTARIWIATAEGFFKLRPATPRRVANQFSRWDEGFG